MVFLTHFRRLSIKRYGKITKVLIFSQSFLEKNCFGYFKALSYFCHPFVPIEH